MPRKQLAGTWEGSPNFRWTRMIKGVRYRLLCRSKRDNDEEKLNTVFLNLPETDWTQRRSLQAANEWWENWSPLSPQVIAECHTMADNIAKFDRALSRLGIEKNMDNAPLARSIFENLDAIQEPIPQGKSLQYWIEQYLLLKLSEKPSAGRYDNLKRSLRKFAEVVGENAPVTAIDWQIWDKYSINIKSSGFASSTARDYISDARVFIRWLQRRSLIEEVKNISETRTKVLTDKIDHFSTDELRKILKKSTGMLRCFLLLFCNCGFRQSDVSTLTPEMFDGKYITRKRKKTEKTNAPEVSWILWPETIQAIEEFKNESGELLFTRPDGKPWVIEELNSKNTRGRDDAFRRMLWKAFAKSHKMRLSCDKIRGSCANLLKVEPDGKKKTNTISVQVKYLAHSPSGMTLKHYVDPPQNEFDTAILWLRGTLLD